MEYADYHHAMAQQLSNNNQISHLHPHQIPLLSASGLNLTVMSCGVTNNTGQQVAQVANTGQAVMYQNVQTVNAGQVQPGTQMIAVHHINHGHGGSKKKKPKVNKDGIPAPKRATTAYINFTQWYREELKKAGRTIPKIGDFGKECAGKWNGMTEEEKSPFLNHAAKDRERYRKEMAIYKPARDANKPKRPGTAFMLFMADFRKEMAGKEPEGGVAALAKLGGERWRGMTEEDKRPYVDKQNEEKVRYEINMEDYRRKTEETKTAGMTPGQSMGSGDAGSPKQARLSTEGSEGVSSPVNSDSGGATNTNNSEQMGSEQDQSVSKRNENSPSPGTSCSSPQAQTLSPNPIQQQQNSQQQNQQTQSIANSSNNMSSLPSMSISHAITNSHTTAIMAGYPQHTFTTAYPTTGVLAAGTATTANYNQAHSGNMTSSSPSYLQSGTGGNYSNQSHLPGHYTWN